MISAEEPKVADNGRYTATETCKALGIHRDTLTRYRKSGRIKATYRKIDGRRVYTGSEIKKIWRMSL